MKFRDYPKFFGAITKLFIKDSDFYKTFINYGFDPMTWPECDAKAIAILFHEKAQNKSVEYARLHMQNQAGKLLDHPISEEQNDLVVEFEQYKTYGLWTQAAQAIMNNPFSATEIVAGLQQQSTSSVGAIMLQAYLDTFVETHIKEIKENKEQVVAIPNWPVLSDVIGGFNPGRVFLFVAGTGVGKTTFTLNLALDALKKMSVLFINMEMTVKDVVGRIVQTGAGLTSNEWNKTFSKNEEQKVGGWFSKIYGGQPFFLTDGRSLTIDQIKSLVFRYKTEHNISLVVVDYDQKIRTSFRGEEWQTIQRAVEELEEVAKATNTAIIVLAQGDENNAPKASKRSMQACSSVISLSKHVDENDESIVSYFLESKKNRFGPAFFKIELNCDMAKFQMREKGFYQKPAILPQPKRGAR